MLNKMGPMGEEQDPYSEECCEEAVDTLLEAEEIKADPELMKKIGPMIDEKRSALDKLSSQTVNSSKGIDGLKETAKKRIKELA
jgi:chaperonin cofactor prefoldin